MIYTEMTLKAVNVAYNAHHGQYDKSGAPYILHPLHLAEQMDDELSCTVALLHDVAEDTDITLRMLGESFPKEVMEPLALLTHDKSVDYFDYIRAIKNDPCAKKVKLADLAHNSDASRMTAFNPVLPEKYLALREKYAKALEILLS